jgi:hypothetical protein
MTKRRIVPILVERAKKGPGPPAGYRTRNALCTLTDAVNLLKAAGFAVVLYLFAVGFGSFADEIGTDPRLIEYVVGTPLAIFVATRERYRPDWQGWFLLFLGPWGWLVAFWRRFNQLDRMRRAPQRRVDLRAKRLMQRSRRLRSH